MSDKEEALGARATAPVKEKALVQRHIRVGVDGGICSSELQALGFALHRRVGGSAWLNRSGQQIFLTSKSSSFCWYKSPISPAGHPTSRQWQQEDSDEEDRRPHDNIFTFMIGFVTVFLSIVFLFCRLCCHDCLLYNFFLFAAALFRDTFEGLFWGFLVVKLAFFIQ